MIAGSVITLIILAALSSILTRLSWRAGSLVVAAIPAALGALYAARLPRVAAGEVFTESRDWIGELGAAAAFRLDGLAMLFALLITFIGALVLAYTSSYMRGKPGASRLVATLVAFMAAMLGVVTADNLILLFIFWELTSVTSFLLIGFDHERERARVAALQALLVTATGGLALLAGIVLLGVAGGTFRISELTADAVLNHPYYPAIVVLVLAGAITKSANMPLHFWLPNAMEAPSPVSALLHSATMVKAGVYLVARLNPTLSGSLLWDETLTIVGAGTMLIAAAIALGQRELKRILAYSTVSSLGTLMMLLGMGAAKAAAAYLLAHAMFKGCLFLVAGAVTKITHEKDPFRIAGLARHAPLLAATGMIGALSMAGMFPLVGFVGKELLLKAGISHPEWAAPVTAITAGAGALTVAAALLVGFKPFIGASTHTDSTRPRLDALLIFPPAALAIAGLVGGLAPSLFTAPIVAATAASITGSPVSLETSIRPIDLAWPITTATILSAVAIITGVALYLARSICRNAGARLAVLRPVTPERAYFATLSATLGFARSLTSFLQNGSLQSYVRTTLLTIIAVSVLALTRSGLVDRVRIDAGDLSAPDLALAGALVIAAIAATLQRTALASVAALGGVGFIIAVYFALHGAPDLAMTQFAVETLVVIIFVLVIFHLPRYRTLVGRTRRALDAATAAAFGGVLAMLSLAATSGPALEPISGFFAEKSVPEAFGRNVVNVILVDFRALDTLGEVFVVGVAAIGVYTLLRVRAATEESDPEGASR